MVREKQVPRYARNDSQNGNGKGSRKCKGRRVGGLSRVGGG
jgi:hypothetical protein